MSRLQLLLLLVLLAPLTNCHAARKHHALTVKVLDVHSNKPLPNAKVKITRKKKVIRVGFTNDSGLVIFPNLKTKRMYISIGTSDGMFQPIKVRRDFLYRGDDTYEFGLFPSKKSEAIIWAKEDSIYGSMEEAEIFKGRSHHYDDHEARLLWKHGSIYWFIKRNIDYPYQLLNQDIQGFVVARFVVEKDGEISHIKIEDSDAQEFSQAVTQMLHTMPKWEPRIINEKKVRTAVRMPISFRIHNL